MTRHTLKHAKRPAVVVGKIYANWCGHCTALAPEWEKMKSQLKSKHSSIVFEEIEQSEEAVKLNRVNRLYRKGAVKQVAMQDGYPTIFKIVNGKLSYYNGPRTADALVRWVDTPSSKGGVESGETVSEEIVKNTMLGGKTRKSRSRRRKTCKKCKSIFSFFS
jgi:thiol-disulfide isomerase/thioredoxin